MRSRLAAASLAILAILAGTAHGAAPPDAWHNSPVQAVAAAIDTSPRITLPGNVRPEANGANDRGRVPDTLALPHMQLLLKRTAERQAALDQFIRALHTRTSPTYHRWLSAREFAQNFGVAPADVSAVTRWLTAAGFTVNGIDPGLRVIDFSGTAGQVHEALHAEIHSIWANGRLHIANMSDPQIPASLANQVEGIVALHDFPLHTNHKPRATYTFTSGSNTYYAISPADIATIYNLNPLYRAGLSGQGQTIAVVQDTDLYSTADWNTFRSAFGLSTYTSGTLTQSHPQGTSHNCTDPGVVNGDQFEAAVDAEWASAAAPSASIVVASCANTTTYGVLIAIQNLVSSASPPAVISVSYGACEPLLGATANAAFQAAYSQAVALGTSVVVAAGDEGAAGCDAAQAYASHGVAVNGLASTPYNVAVGGTDFADRYTSTQSVYWSATNGAGLGSALSYVPEMPWNDSCAGAFLSTFGGYASAYGTTGYCNSTSGASYLTISAGGGGPSSCASGAASVSGTVSGSCAGYAKPSWQAGVTGLPADGVRDLPDVALFSGNGIWGHYYLVCDSDSTDTLSKGLGCTGAPSTWNGAGGTSFAAPIFAGIQALVDQKYGRQGNPNPVFYTLAASQAAAGTPCNSSSGNQVSSNCVFNDITQGDTDVDCKGTINCYLPSGTYGVLSTSSSNYSKTYSAAVGWDFASGLGSVNASNLVNNWNSSDLSLSVAGQVTAAHQLSYVLTVGNTGPQTASSVAISATLPTGVTLVSAASSSGCAQAALTLTCTVGSLAKGTTSTLTVVLQPNNTNAVSLSFTASSASPDINPNNDVVNSALMIATASNVPLPPWSQSTLALLCALSGLYFGKPRRTRRNIGTHTAAPNSSANDTRGTSRSVPAMRRSGCDEPKALN